MKKCLIYLDAEQMQNSIELLGAACRLYPEEDVVVYGAAVNHDGGEGTGLFDYILSVQAPGIEPFDAKGLAALLAELHHRFDFDAILIPATWTGRMLAPRLAVRLHAGLTADVTEIRRRDENLELVRPAFSGRLLAGIMAQGEGPVMMSVRQNVFVHDPNRTRETRIIAIRHAAEAAFGIRQIDVVQKERIYDIRKSDVLISGGGGVGRDFQRLNKLADALDGQIAASRSIVDKGIAPRGIQVGQSGKTVSPKLYLALGIFGAIQHVEGLRNVEHIIAVNTNSSAPICSLSDMVVEGDALEFVDRLTERIQRYREERK